MTTFLELRTDVQVLVIDLPPAVLAAVPRLVNEAIRSMQRGYNFRAMEVVTPFTTATGVLQLGTIANFKEYRDKGPYILRQYTRGRKLLTAIDSDVDQAVLASTSLPQPPEFVINTVNQSTGAWTFSIAPYPDINSDWPDGNYRIVIPSYNYTAPLVNDGDSNWFTNNANDFIVYKATAEAFGRDWDYDSMALWLQRADEKLKEIKKADKTNRLSSVDALVPMWRGANQPQVRR